MTISKCEEHFALVDQKEDEVIVTIICKKCIAGFYVKTLISGDKIITTCELPEVLLDGCYRYQTETQCV